MGDSNVVPSLTVSVLLYLLYAYLLVLIENGKQKLFCANFDENAEKTSASLAFRYNFEGLQNFSFQVSHQSETAQIDGNVDEIPKDFNSFGYLQDFCNLNMIISLHLPSHMTLISQLNISSETEESVLPKTSQEYQLRLMKRNCAFWNMFKVLIGFSFLPYDLLCFVLEKYLLPTVPLTLKF